MSNSNTPPSNVSISTPNEPISMLPLPVDSPLTLDSTSRKSTSTINSSRRINIQSQAHSHSTPESVTESSEVNEEEGDNGIDFFEEMINDF